jgi:hypothetical protein
MKNIHVLPTENPSNLTVRTKTNELLYSYKLFSSKNGSDINVNQHIYITSDEEIKEVDYGLDVFHKEVRKFRNKNFVTKYDKKIILTTDQDLIADGVQAIDDEFLEWFVKNPTCEFVEIRKYHSGILSDISEITSSLKIIIPQEEPKQETFEEAAERLYPRLINDPYNPMEDDNKEDRDTWLKGANYQAERMYSEEEVLELLLKFNDDKPGGFDASGWFEQFKNK